MWKVCLYQEGPGCGWGLISLLGVFFGPHCTDITVLLVRFFSNLLLKFIHDKKYIFFFCCYVPLLSVITNHSFPSSRNLWILVLFAGWTPELGQSFKWFQVYSGLLWQVPSWAGPTLWWPQSKWWSSFLPVVTNVWKNGSGSLLWMVWQVPSHASPTQEDALHSDFLIAGLFLSVLGRH